MPPDEQSIASTPLPQILRKRDRLLEGPPALHVNRGHPNEQRLIRAIPCVRPRQPRAQERRKQLVHQIAMRRMDLQHLEARVERATSCLHPPVDDAGYLFRRKRRRRGHSRGWRCSGPNDGPRRLTPQTDVLVIQRRLAVTAAARAALAAKRGVWTFVHDALCIIWTGPSSGQRIDPSLAAPGGADTERRRSGTP